MRKSLVYDDTQTEINLSPMIDCIFILLIFFIVTTVFVEETGIQVEKPDAAAATSLEQKENVVLRIAADGKVFADQREVTVADIPGLVRASVNGGTVPVVIRAHEKSSHATFVRVWDAAKRGGADLLSFTTTN